MCAGSRARARRAPRALAMLRLMGLFDRPANAGCLAALWTAPAIEGLTEPLFKSKRRGSAEQKYGR